MGMNTRQRKCETSGKNEAAIATHNKPQNIRWIYTEKDMAIAWAGGSVKALREQRAQRRGPPCKIFDGKVGYPAYWETLWCRAGRIINGKMRLAGGGLVPAAHVDKYESALEKAAHDRWEKFHGRA